MAPLSLKDPMTRTSDGKASTRPCKDGRATVTERTEASNIGPADRSGQARSLFLHEGRTMNPSLRRKRLWPPERRAVRVSARKCVPGQRKTRGNVTLGFRLRDVNNLKHVKRAQEFACDIAPTDGPAESQSHVARWRDADRPEGKIWYERLRTQ